MYKISVLMPVYNAEKFLRESVESVIKQTFQDWQLIVCNDGSTDKSLQILEEYARWDKRIKILNNPHNMGITATRNNLLKAIPEQCGFVAWLDADDICYPERLQKQIDFLISHPEIGAVSAALEIIDENSCTTGWRSYPCSSSEIRCKLPRVNVIAQPVIMLRKDVLDSIGFYSENYPYGEDYQYWLRVLEKYEFANLPEPLLRYRISGNQSKQKHLKETLCLTLQIQREYYRRIGRMMPFSGIMHQLAGKMLMLLPNKLILKLFMFLSYKNK